MTIINKNIKPSVYMLESSNLWHSRLRHVNYDTLHRLINLDHIPLFQIDSKHKCETCVEANIQDHHFKLLKETLNHLN